MVTTSWNFLESPGKTFFVLEKPGNLAFFPHCPGKSLRMVNFRIFFVRFYFSTFIYKAKAFILGLYEKYSLFFILEFDRFIISIIVHCLFNLSCVSEINNFSLILTVKSYLYNVLKSYVRCMVF